MPSQPPRVPPNFLPARDVHHAKLLKHAPPFIRQPKKRGRKWAGIKYERAAHEYFCELLAPYYTPGPWISFVDGPSGEHRFCQPDGLIIQPERGRVTIVEFKYTHTELAYWQLFHLYLPVVQALFPPNLWKYAGVEICARYDCAIVCPEQPRLRKNVFDAFPTAFNVHIWRP